MAIASGVGNYTELNQTQYKIQFVPTAFEVLVSVTTKTIEVQPTTLDITDIESSGYLAANKIDSVNLLSRMSNSLYVSVFNNSLHQNVLNKQLHLNMKTSSVSDAIATAAMEDSFSAIFDDILVS